MIPAISRQTVLISTMYFMIVSSTSMNKDILNLHLFNMTRKTMNRDIGITAGPA